MRNREIEEREKERVDTSYPLESVKSYCVDVRVENGSEEP